jgi:uracil DNA glycosylase
MDIASLPVHDSWMPLLNTYQEKISQIFTELAGENLAPPQGQIFRALEIDLAQVRVVIFGQDPYPRSTLQMVWPSPSLKNPVGIRHPCEISCAN